MSWSTVNRLKFNEEKTEFIVAISDHLKHLLPPVTLRIGSKIIHPSESVRNLGIVFDTSMTMNAHITSLCTSLNYQMRNISRIRRFLDTDICHPVVRALILTRLDYGNALLFGSNATDIQRLQRKQNWAAKLVCRASKRDHATPYVYVYKCLNGTAPSYLSSYLSRSPHRPGYVQAFAQHLTLLASMNQILSSCSSLLQVAPFLILLPKPGMHSLSPSENLTLYANSKSVSKISCTQCAAFLM